MNLIETRHKFSEESSHQFSDHYFNNPTKYYPLDCKCFVTINLSINLNVDRKLYVSVSSLTFMRDIATLWRPFHLRISFYISFIYFAIVRPIVVEETSLRNLFRVAWSSTALSSTNIINNSLLNFCCCYIYGVTIGSINFKIHYNCSSLLKAHALYSVFKKQFQELHINSLNGSKQGKMSDTNLSTKMFSIHTFSISTKNKIGYNLVFSVQKTESIFWKLNFCFTSSTLYN